MESNLSKLSFERAVELFEEWGFRVEEGPGHDEVTLILEGPAHCSYCVYEVSRLPQIAAAALRVRRNIAAKKSAAISSTATSQKYQYPLLQPMLN
ncbi:MAG TPA: hypothetical protein VFG29_13450 [Syntrophales bacterium]|nr:hypothetical protein [Syntrophales bacterium]